MNKVDPDPLSTHSVLFRWSARIWDGFPFDQIVPLGNPHVAVNIQMHLFVRPPSVSSYDLIIHSIVQ